MTRQPYTLGRIKPDDISLLLDLVRELATHEGRPGAVSATGEMLAELLFGPAPVADGFFCLAGDEIVAYALVCEKFSSFRGRRILHVEDILVRKQVQGRGAGRFMMSALAAEAVRRRCCAMQWSALATNADAIAFYGRLGVQVEQGHVHFDASGDALDLLAEYGAESGNKRV